MGHKLFGLLFFFLILLFGGALLQACTPESETAVTAIPTPTPQPTASATTAAATAVPLTLEALITRLEAAGLQVTVGETFPGHIFSVPVQTLRVNDGSVLVYEYLDLDTAVTEAGWIRSNGYEFHFPDPDNPGQMIAMILEPTGTPHYFRLENLLVNYIGDDLEILARLAQVLGPQFIGGPLPMPTPTAEPSPTAALTSDQVIMPPEITHLALLGNGQIDSLTWLPDGKTFAVGSSTGVDYYDGQALQPTHSLRDAQMSGSIHIQYRQPHG